MMIAVSKTRTENTPTKVPTKIGTEIAANVKIYHNQYLLLLTLPQLPAIVFVLVVPSDGISVLVVAIVSANNCVVSNITSPSVVEECVVEDLVVSNINVGIAGEVVD